MNIEQYKAKKDLLLSSQKQYKSKCRACWQPQDTCICSFTDQFFPNLHFVILTHPVEASKRIASGRIAHACLQDSHFFRGYDFLNKNKINDIIADDKNSCYVLYPGRSSLNISDCSDTEIKQRIDFNKNVYIFVIDGTWGNSNKMLRLSPNLATLPKICFTPSHPSEFKVRKQPKEFCLSSLEAINEVIHLLSPFTNYKYDINNNPLMMAFRFLVSDQLQKMDNYKSKHGQLNNRSSKKRPFNKMV